MIRIKKYDDLHIQVITQDKAYVSDLKAHFTDYVDGYRHMPRFKAGGWNGKICVMASNNTLPYGLLFDVIKFHKTKYKHLELQADEDVKAFFDGTDIDPEYNLNMFPRPYQADSIEACLKYRSGIIVAATASGKSCIISYIIKALLDNQLAKKFLIIVPTINLVTQFHSDMVEYGIEIDLIGRVYSKLKEFDKTIVVSTWQTLIKNYDRLDAFECVLCDEVHSAKSLSIKTILSKMTNAGFRYGFTGTLPPTNLDIFNIKGYLGPVLKTFTATELADQGYISHCKVNFVNFIYDKKEKYDGEYNDVKDMIFNNHNRLKFIKNKVQEFDSNVLVLVGKIEKEGKVLQDYLQANIKDKEVVFIYGNTKPEDREFWRLELGKRNDIILIASYQIFQMGVNAPSLKYLLFASPFKSKIRILQSIGRTLRKHETKDNAEIWDIADQVTYLDDHAMRRRRFYVSEKFELNEITVDENLSVFQ